MSIKRVLSLLLFSVLTVSAVFGGEDTDKRFGLFLQASEGCDNTEELALTLIGEIERDLAEAEDPGRQSEVCYRLAILYDSLIHDASSWMKYAPPLEFRP